MNKNKNRNIKFSIITVCFNSEATIESTLNSIASQTYDNYEIIIIDGLSTDSTMDIVNNYKGIFENKLKFVSEPDKGIYDAMNKGIKMARGDYVGILNSDDTYETDALQSFLEEINKSQSADIFYGFERVLNSDNEQVQIQFISRNDLLNTPLRHQSIMVKKDIYDLYGLYDLKYKYAADYDFFLRMSLNPKIKFVTVPKIIDNFSLDGASTVGISSILCLEEFRNIQYKYKVISRKKYYLSKL